MSTADGVLSDQDVGVDWNSPKSGILSDEDVGLSWEKPKQIGTLTEDQWKEREKEYLRQTQSGDEGYKKPSLVQAVKAGLPEVSEGLAESPFGLPYKAAKLLVPLIQQSPEEQRALARNAAAERERASMMGAMPPDAAPVAFGAGRESLQPVESLATEPTQIPEAMEFQQAIVNELGDQAKEFVSPVNIGILLGTVGAGSLGKIGEYIVRGVTGYFGVQGALAVKQAAEELGAAKTPDEKGRAWAKLAAGAGVAIPALTHAAKPPKLAPESFPAVENPDVVARQGMEPSPLIGQPPPNEVAHKLPPGSVAPEMIQADPSMRRFAGVDVNDLQILPSAEETALLAQREAELRGRQTITPGGEQFVDPLRAPESEAPRPMLEPPLEWDENPTVSLRQDPRKLETVDQRLLQVSRESSERGNETLPPGDPLFREQPQAEPPLPEAYRKPQAEGPGVPTQSQLLEERLGRRDMLETVKKLGETPASIAPKLIDELRGRPQTSVRPHAEEILWKTIIDKLEQERLGTDYKPPTDLPPEVKAAQVKAVANAQAIGLTRSVEAATEAVKGKKPNASGKPSATSVPEREIRSPVGEETPLRQQGEAAGTRAQPAQAAEERSSPEPAKAEVPLIEQVSALKSTEDATAFGRTQKTPEGIAALEAARAELVKRWKAGDVTAERAAYLAREALQAAKGEEGELAKAKPPVRVKVIEQQTGEEPIKYVSIQAEGNAVSGDAAYWRKKGFDVPDFDKLPPGEYTLDEAKAKLKEANAPQAKPAEPVGGSAPVPVEKPVSKAGAMPDLREDVPDTTQAKARLKRADESRADLRKKYDVLKKEYDDLRREITTNRGSRRGTLRIKQSANKAKAQRYGVLQSEMSKLDEAMRVLDDSVKEERRLTGAAETIDVINDEKRPLLQRLDRKIRLMQDRQQEIPKALIEARDAETRRVILEKYPDATPEEIKAMGGQVQVGASLYGDPWKDMSVPNLNRLRRAKLDALVNASDAIPQDAYPEALQEKLQKLRTGGNEPISAKDVGAAETEIKAAKTAYREKVEAERKAHEEATIKAKAEEAKMMADAQKVVDSAPRSRDAKMIKAELVSRIMEEVKKTADADGVTIKPQPEAPNEFVAETGDKTSWSMGRIEKKGNGFSVEAWRAGQVKDKVRANVATLEEGKEVIRGMAARGVGNAVIAVPGDGIYRLVRDGEKLLSVWRRAKGLDTSKGRSFGSPSGGGQSPPTEIKTKGDWREAQNFHELENSDTIHDWSPALRKLAEKVDPKAPEKVTVRDVDAFIKAKEESAKPSDTAKKIADKLRDQLKTPETGAELHSFGVIPKVINAAVEVAARIIEAGGTIADGIAEAIDYIRRNHEGNFNEGGFRRMLHEKYSKVAPPAPPAEPPPPTPPASGPAPVPPTPPPTPSAGWLRSKLRAVRDYITVDPIPRLTREMGEASQSAIEHAKARSAVPLMIDNLLAKVFPDQYHDPKAMARTMDVLKKDDILGGYDDFRARQAEAEASGDTREAARWRNLADRIGSAQDLHQLAQDVEAGRRDPVIAANIARWKRFVNPELDQLYNEMKGVDPATEREGRGRVFGARTNLLPLNEEAKWQNALTGDEANPLPQQNASNYRNPNAKRDKFDRVAKLTGEYSDNPAAILANVLYHRWNEVTKLRFFNDLVRSENATWEAPPDGTIRGKPASRLAVKVPETNEAGVTRQVEKNLWVPKDLVEEIRGVLGTDLNLKANPVGQALNKIQIYQMADFVAHTKNQVSAVANSPSGKAWAAEMARRFPGLNVADAVARIGKAAFDVHGGSPSIRAEMDWMGRHGLLRDKSLYHDEGFWNKPIKVTHDFLYKNDVAMRVVMNRFYNTLVENGLAPDSMVQRRKFVGQAGEYNSRLLGPMMRAARSSGLAPFVVAGRNFNRFAVRRITGNPGFKPTSLKASALLRGTSVYTLAAAVAVPAIFNWLTQGSFTGRAGTPLGAFDLGGDKDDKGNHRIFDWAQLMGIRRGARITGLDALAEGLISGRDADEVVGKAFGESAQALAHPWMGPALGFVGRAVFGKNIDLRAGPQPEEARNMGSPYSIKQKLENARVAVKNQNRPLYGLAVRPFVGDTEEGYWKDLLGDLGRSPLSAGGARKAVSPALEEARLLSITGTPATVESVERAKLKRKLAKSMREGDDKPVQDAVDAGLLSKRDVTELEQKTTQEPLVYLVHRHLSAAQAMRVWNLSTPEEKKQLFDIVADKVNRDQKTSEELVQKWADELNKFQER